MSTLSANDGNNNSVAASKAKEETFDLNHNSIQADFNQIQSPSRRTSGVHNKAELVSHIMSRFQTLAAMYKKTARVKQEVDLLKYENKRLGECAQDLVDASSVMHPLSKK